MGTLHKVLLEDVMVGEPHTIEVDEPFSQVWKKLQDYKIRHLPVVDANRKLAGIITQRDLYRIVSPKKAEGSLVYEQSELDRYILEHVMTKNVTTLSPGDTIGKAMDIMIRYSYGCVPIVDEGNYLCGIVTQIDILKAVAPYFV